MHLPNRFPPELLSQPLPVKLDYVHQIAISHPHLTSIGDTIMPFLNAGDSTQILYLGGPTGVGKTVAFARIVHQLSVQSQPQPVPPSDSAGLLHVALGSLLETTFSRKAYLHLMLWSLVAYLDRQPRPDGETHSDTPDETKARVRAPRHRRTIEVYAELIAQLRYHWPRAIIIDDAQLLIRTTSRDVLAAHIGVISDIAAATGITHVLAGTYDLREIVNGHAHMDAEARCLHHVVHFPRYRSDIPQDAQTFRAVLQSLQQQLPFEKEPQLVNLADYCWEHSLGCVGILVPWIIEAAAWNLRNGCSTLTATSLQRFRLSAHKIAHLRSEIEDGEAWWAAEALQSKEARS